MRIVEVGLYKPHIFHRGEWSFRPVARERYDNLARTWCFTRNYFARDRVLRFRRRRGLLNGTPHLYFRGDEWRFHPAYEGPVLDSLARDWCAAHNPCRHNGDLHMEFSSRRVECATCGAVCFR